MHVSAKRTEQKVRGMGTKSAWTPERRARQAEIIQRTRPWENSTGPKTEAGKAVSSQNACLPQSVQETREVLANIRAQALAVFGRRSHEHEIDWGDAKRRRRR